jgi:hypothetical protein
MQISPMTGHMVKTPNTVHNICVQHWVKLKPYLYSLHPTYIEDVSADHRPTLQSYKQGMHSYVSGKPLIKEKLIKQKCLVMGL